MADESAKLRELRRLLADYPESAIKRWRKESGLSQVEVGEEVGATQAHISDLEHGRRELTRQMANRLGPTLGVEPEQLLAEELLSDVKVMAAKSADELSPILLVELVEFLDQTLPETVSNEKLMDALLELAEERLVAYRKQREAGRAALKAREAEGTRDRFGRRIRKPYGLRERR